MNRKPLADRRAHSLSTLAGQTGLEPLEGRALLTAVSWTGNAGDSLWHTPGNWSTNAVPGAADDVTIDVAANPTIRFTASSGSRTVNSLLTRENFQLEGGTLTVNTSLTVDNATFNMQSGTLANASMAYVGTGAMNFTTLGGQLTNVATNTDILLNSTSEFIQLTGTTSFNAVRIQANAALLALSPGYTINGPVSVEGAAAGTRTIQMAYGGAGAVTLGAAGSIKIAAGAGGGLNIQNSSLATFVSNGLISSEAVGQTLSISTNAFNPAGTVQVLAGALTIGGASMTGAATAAFSAATGTTLTLGATTWSNAGSININGATLTLDGGFTTSGFNFAGFTRTGGTVNLKGTLTNTGSTLTLNASTGSWQLLGGTITNGSLTFAGGSTLIPTTSLGLLANVAVTGEILVNTNSAGIQISGASTIPVVRLQANGASLLMSPGANLPVLTSAEGALAGSRIIQIGYGGVGTVTLPSGSTVRLAAGTAANLTFQNSSTGTLQLDGTLVNEAVGQTITLNNTGLNIAGSIQASAGTITVNNATMSGVAAASMSVASGAVLNLGATNWTYSGTIAVNGGTLNLDGAFATSTFNIAGISRTGGTINLKGVLNNSASTLTLNAATGTWLFSGGVINGGTLAFAGGSVLQPTSTSGELSSVTVSGEMLLNTASAGLIVGGSTTMTAIRMTTTSNLAFRTGYTLSYPVIAEGAGSGTRSIQGGYGGSGTLTIGPTGQIKLASGAGGGITIQNSSTATLVNNGNISAEAAGQSITINTTGFTNSGNAKALAGNLRINATNWTNPGTLGADVGAIVDLDGTLDATSGIGTLQNAGGGVFWVSGTITNTGNTITLNSGTGTLTMHGGTISGGSIVLNNGLQILSTTSGGTLAGVAITGSIALDVSSSYIILSGATTFTSLRMLAGNTTTYLATGYTLNNAITAEGAATGSRTVIVAYGGAGSNSFSSTASVRLLAGSGGSLLINQSSVGVLNNSGLIAAEAAGLSLTIQSATFNNLASGKVRALAGTLRLNSGTNATNAGTMDVANNATLDIDGTFNATGGIGTFINAGTGVTWVSGTINNTGNTITLNATTGSWTMHGGNISGGSLVLSGGTSLLTTSSGGAITNLAITGEVLLNTSSAVITHAGTSTYTALRLTAGSTTLQVAPGATLASLISVEGAATGTRTITLAYGGSGTVTQAASGIIRLASTSGGSLTIGQSSVATFDNNGLISAEAAGLTMTIQPANFNNKASGTVQALAGTLRLNMSTSLTNAGTFLVANGATFDIDGVFNTTGGLGTFTNAGTGITWISGNITNTGNTITLNASTGSWTMHGGTISGGSLILNGGVSLLTTTSGGTITNLAITGEVLLNTSGAYLIHAGASTYTALRMTTGNTSLYVAPGATLASLISAEGAATGTRTITMAYGGSGTVTQSAAGTIRLSTGAGGSLMIAQSSVATFVNNGMVSAEAVGQSITIQTATFSNGAGVARAQAGTLRLNSATASSNSGTLSVANNATLDIDGVFNATGGIGTLTNAGTGVTWISGTINNTGNTITLNNTTGSWTMHGGNISGGSLILNGGVSLLTTTTGGTITNLAITGEVLLNTSGAYIIHSGNSTYTALRMTAGNTTLYVTPGAVLASLISAEGAATGTRTITMAYGASGAVTQNGTIRLAAGTPGSLNINQSSAATLNNNGTIAAAAAGQSVTIQMNTINNNASGILQAQAGTLRMNASGQSFNAGTFSVSNGATFDLDGVFNANTGIGTLTNQGSGTTWISGTIINTGNTIALNATTGPWTMHGGTINSGLITLTGVQLFGTSSGGTFNSVAITGDLNANVTSAYFVLNGVTRFTNVRLSGGSTALYMTPGYVLRDNVIGEGAAGGTRSVVIAYGGSGNNEFASTSTVTLAAGTGAGMTISQSSVGTLNANGLIRGQAVGVPLSITPNTLSNQGTIDAAGSNVLISVTNFSNVVGNMLTGGVWKASNGGSLTGGGSFNIKNLGANVILDGANKGWDALNKLEAVIPGITFQLTGGTDQTVAPATLLFTNNGTIILGLGSRLTITGSFRQVAGATLEVHIAGGNPLTNYGSITASGTGQLGGVLNIIADNGYVPSRPDIQDVVKTTGSCTGTFSAVTFPVTNNPDWATYFVYTGNGAQLITTSIIDFNIDGQVDLEDFFIFFNRWDTFDPTLDLNNDGGVDLGDFFLFFNLWDQG